MSYMKVSELENMPDKYVKLGQDGIFVPVLSSKNRILYKTLYGAINIKSAGTIEIAKEWLAGPKIIIAQRCFSPDYIENFGRMIKDKKYVKVTCYINMPLYTSSNGYLAIQKGVNINDFKTYLWVDTTFLDTSISCNFSQLDTVMMRPNSGRFNTNRRKINKIFN